VCCDETPRTPRCGARWHVYRLRHRNAPWARAPARLCINVQSRRSPCLSRSSRFLSAVDAVDAHPPSSPAALELMDALPTRLLRRILLPSAAGTRLPDHTQDTTRNVGVYGHAATLTQTHADKHTQKHTGTRRAHHVRTRRTLTSIQHHTACTGSNGNSCRGPNEAVNKPRGPHPTRHRPAYGHGERHRLCPAGGQAASGRQHASGPFKSQHAPVHHAPVHHASVLQLGAPLTLPHRAMRRCHMLRHRRRSLDDSLPPVSASLRAERTRHVALDPALLVAPQPTCARPTRAGGADPPARTARGRGWGKDAG